MANIRISIRSGLGLLFWCMVSVTSVCTGIAAATTIEFGEIETPAVIIRYEKPLEGVARDLGNRFYRVKEELEAFFYWPLTPSPTFVMLFHQQTSFRQTVSNPHIVASFC